MTGPKQEAQGALFYEFSLEDHVPGDHFLRSIDRFVDLAGIRTHLAPVVHFQPAELLVQPARGAEIRLDAMKSAIDPAGHDLVTRSEWIENPAQDLANYDAPINGIRNKTD